jgi:alpha-amylase
MVDICFYFQVHRPIKITNYRVFDIGYAEEYFDCERNRDLILKASKECYNPANKMLMKLIEKHGKKFSVAFSISGITIEMLEKYAPQTLESFKELAKTGQVEFLSETYYHSLSFLYSKAEFKRQIDLHKELIKKHFGQEPKVFRNTELLYSNDIATFIEEMGYKGILCEGEGSSIGWKSPNFLYKAYTPKGNMSLLVRNKKLSNDIAKRFSNKDWEEYPLSPKRYLSSIVNSNPNSQVVNLFMKYENFGLKHSKDSGIFEFFEEFSDLFLKDKNNRFVTPTELIGKNKKGEKVDVPFFVSWGEERVDLNSWLGNKMQECAIKEIFMLEEKVKKLKNKEMLIKWRKLTLSDHYYSMSTNNISKETNRVYGPYDSYVHFMNILNDMIVRIKIMEKKKTAQKEIMKNPKKKGIINDIKMAIKK